MQMSLLHNNQQCTHACKTLLLLPGPFFTASYSFLKLKPSVWVIYRTDTLTIYPKQNTRASRTLAIPCES